MSRRAAPKASLEPAGEGRFSLRGELGFANAAELLEEGLRRFGDAGPVEVDLAGVTHADSAGVAVLVEWVAAARRSGRELRYKDAPSQLLAIARLGGVDGLLPLA